MAELATKVHEWSTEAADAYLGRSVPLNDTIRKIASREKLNREKVARVVEEANKAVWLKKFDKEADKTFTFPVADIDEILKKEDFMPVKVAAPIARIRPAPAMEKVATLTERLDEQTARGTGLQQATRYCERATLEAEMLRDKAAMEYNTLLEAEARFCKIAQEMVHQDGHSFEDLMAAMTEYRPDQFGKIALLMKAAAIHMGEECSIPEGLEKRAGGMIDPGEHDIVTQISASGMPVEVINGSHKLVVALDTLIDQATRADRANKNLISADDTVKYLRKELRNYIATHRHL